MLIFLKHRGDTDKKIAILDYEDDTNLIKIIKHPLHEEGNFFDKKDLKALVDTAKNI